MDVAPPPLIVPNAEAARAELLSLGHEVVAAVGSPNGEIVVLKSKQLTLFTGCVVGLR